MAEAHRWYLVTYDVTDDQRRTAVHATLKGWGEWLQFSVFRIWVTEREREQLRWKLAQTMTPADSLLVVGICDSCVERVRALNPRNQWPDPPPPFVVL